MTNYKKRCSFPHANFSGTMKSAENLSKKAKCETLNYWKDIHCRYTFELQFQCVQTIYITENKDTSLKFTFKTSTMLIVFVYLNI